MVSGDSREVTIKVPPGLSSLLTGCKPYHAHDSTPLQSVSSTQMVMSTSLGSEFVDGQPATSEGGLRLATTARESRATGPSARPALSTRRCSRMPSPRCNENQSLLRSQPARPATSVLDDARFLPSPRLLPPMHGSPPARPGVVPAFCENPGVQSPTGAGVLITWTGD